MVQALRTSLRYGGLRQGGLQPGLGGDSIFATSSLDLNFAKHKNLGTIVDATTGANLVDFTRASSGTYVDSEGVIRTATTNLLLQSENFSTTWFNFNSSEAVNQAIAPDGTLTADKLIPNTGVNNGLLRQDIALAAGSNVSVSIYAKAGEFNLVVLSYFNSDGTFYGSGAFNLTTGNFTTSPVNCQPEAILLSNGWYRIQLTGASSGSSGAAGSVRISSSNVGDGTSGIYLWGAQLEQSTTVGEYIPTTSTINSAPRFDHDPTTGESLGLLVEESRQNLLEYSEDISQWSSTTGGSPTITPNADTAPDGTNTATLIENTGAQAFIGDATAYTSGTTYTFSVYFKANDGDQVAILLYSSGALSGFWNSETFNVATIFDLTNGTFTTFAGAVAPTTSTITDAGNGWWRCSITATATSNSNGPNQLIRNMSGVTKGIYAWGYQIEAGSFPTSYIPTSGTAATRAADVASISGSNFSSWYRQDEGTVFTEFRDSPSTQGEYPFAISDNTVSNRFTLFTSGSSSLNSRLISAGSVFNPGNVSFIASSLIRACTAGKTGADQAITACNGVLSNAGSPTSMPAVNRMYIGAAHNGLEQTNGTIRRLTYWPARLPNETLQTITQ